LDLLGVFLLLVVLLYSKSVHHAIAPLISLKVSYTGCEGLQYGFSGVKDWKLYGSTRMYLI